MPIGQSQRDHLRVMETPLRIQRTTGPIQLQWPTMLAENQDWQCRAWPSATLRRMSFLTFCAGSGLVWRRLVWPFSLGLNRTIQRGMTAFFESPRRTWPSSHHPAFAHAIEPPRTNSSPPTTSPPHEPPIVHAWVRLPVYSSHSSPVSVRCIKQDATGPFLLGSFGTKKQERRGQLPNRPCLCKN